MVDERYARIAATGCPHIVEWTTEEGVTLQSHPMPLIDAEAMADVLDADADIFLA